jgi:hypothetical protein
MFEILNKNFSKARILPYINDGDVAEKVLAKYHANILLSEAMIPSLHYFEVCLRNRVDQVIQENYSKNWLVKPPYNLISDKHIKKIETILKNEGKNGKIQTHDDILSQLGFGFWCSFFRPKYDPILWHRKDTLKNIFPNLSRTDRKRPQIEKKILKIKQIRNRIAHHEPIWDPMQSIHNTHAMCHELIRAMSTDIQNMLKPIDRFPVIYQKVSLDLILEPS